MKLKQNRLNCDVKVRSHLSVLVIFVILIFKFNYGLCNQETGDNSDAVLTADSIHNDIMLNDETFKFYDNVDELAANLFNDTLTEYLNDEDDINEENLNKLLESYDKTYTNETWIVVPKDNDIVETINEIVAEFETAPNEEIVIVTQDVNDVDVSRRQHDDLQFGLEFVPVPNEGLFDTTTEGNLNNDRAEDVKNPSTDEIDVHTTETVDGKFRNDETEFTVKFEMNDDTKGEDFEAQTTEAEYFELRNDVSETTSLAPNIDEVAENDDLESTTEIVDGLSSLASNIEEGTENVDLESTTTEIEEGIGYRINKFDSESSKQDLDELENDDLLVEELDPVIFDLPKSAVAEPVYEDYTTEEEVTTKIPDIDELINHKIYLHEAELPITTNNDFTTTKRPESTTSKPVYSTVSDVNDSETEPSPSILQKISSYMYEIFNYPFGKSEGRNFEIDPYNFSTEIFDDIVTTGYDTDRKRAEEQSIREIEKILDPEIKNEFIKDIVIDKSLEVQSVFKKPDEPNILNRGLVDSSTDSVDVEKFIFDKINRDDKSTVEYESDIIDNNLYSNPVQNSGLNHIPIESKPEDKTIIELEKIIDPEIKNEFIKDIPTSSDHIADIPVIETVKVVDNTDGNTEIHMTERNVEEDGKRIHDETKVESIENPDRHRVIHENVHTEHSNDTRIEDHTKIEIETNDTTRIEVQHVTHNEDEKDSHTEKKIEHVTIDKPGLHTEKHETVETIKNKDGDVIDSVDIITKDFDTVHVVDKIMIHEDNKQVYANLLKKVEEIKQIKNKIDELKKEIKILKKDIKYPNELIRYEAEILKNKGYLPDKLELIAGYLNFREQQVQGNTDEFGLKPYLQRLTKERELQILKLTKKKLKKQLIEDFKVFMVTEKKFGIRINEEIELSIEKLDEESQSLSSKSKSKSSDEHDDNDSLEESEERVWNNFLNQARLGVQGRVPRRQEEAKLLQRVLNDETETETPPITPVPVLFPNIDKESQITLLKTLVHIPNVEKEDDLPVTPQTTDPPITTDAIAEEISIEIDELEKIVDEHSHMVKVIDKRVLLHNGDNNLEIEETVNTQNGDVETEEHNKHIQEIDVKTRSRIIEALMPKLRQSEGRSLSIEPDVEQTEEPETESPKLDDEPNDSIITNEALRTVIEGLELTSEIARSVENFRSPIEKITEILTTADQTVTTKTTNELADELGRAEEILGVDENKIVGEIAELEIVGVNLALVLFCILCAFLILIIMIIFFLRKSKRFGGLNFVPV